ncbi:hypothetical protein LTR66_001114 [Elasticomyces elasticus]|nr:hypothetical protein LTR66_001114 [Elasticomyces elasticus]
MDKYASHKRPDWRKYPDSSRGRNNDQYARTIRNRSRSPTASQEGFYRTRDTTTQTYNGYPAVLQAPRTPYVGTDVNLVSFSHHGRPSTRERHADVSSLHPRGPVRLTQRSTARVPFPRSGKSAVDVQRPHLLAPLSAQTSKGVAHDTDKSAVSLLAKEAATVSMTASRSRKFLLNNPRRPILPKEFPQPLTCHFWAKGHCFKSDDDCRYAHYHTGFRAPPPESYAHKLARKNREAPDHGRDAPLHGEPIAVRKHPNLDREIDDLIAQQRAIVDLKHLKLDKQSPSDANSNNDSPRIASPAYPKVAQAMAETQAVIQEGRGTLSGLCVDIGAALGAAMSSYDDERIGTSDQSPSASQSTGVETISTASDHTS